MHKPSALLAAIAFFVALSFVASCGQPEPWEPTADREARAIDRLRYLLEPSEAHAQLFPSTLTDTLRLGKGRYRLIQVESAQNLLVEKFYLGPTSTRPNCNAARSGLFHINASAAGQLLQRYGMGAHRRRAAAGYAAHVQRQPARAPLRG